MSEENTSLPESVKPETEVTESTPNLQTQEGSVEAASPNADSQASTEPESETAGKETDARQPSRAQARIQELVNQRKEAENKAAFWQKRAEALQPKPAGNEQDHPDDASYRRAIHKESITEAQREAAQAQAQEAAELARQSREETFEARVAEFRGKAADFETVTQNPTLRISPLMGDAIKESESGPQIAYYLGKNPDQAARIASLPPIKQVAEIGKLEAQLSTPAKRTTEAPKPVKTVGAGSSSSPVVDLNKASVADFIKIRNAEEAAKRRH